MSDLRIPKESIVFQFEFSEKLGALLDPNFSASGASRIDAAKKIEEAMQGEITSEDLMDPNQYRCRAFEVLRPCVGAAVSHETDGEG